MDMFPFVFAGREGSVSYTHLDVYKRQKGTFAGIAEKIPYLKELGINQLELMPVYEFAEVEPWDEKRPPLRRPGNGQTELLNYWGYADAYYLSLIHI